MQFQNSISASLQVALVSRAGRPPVACIPGYAPYRWIGDSAAKTAKLENFAASAEGQARANRYLGMVALFQALGGGWWTGSDLQRVSDSR
jgi:hypothetical protein